MGLIVFIAVSCISERAISQVSSFIGATYSDIRDAELIHGAKPIWGFHHHLALEVSPSNKLQKFSLRASMGFTQKGYEQYLSSNYYKLQFTYASFGLAANYHLSRFMATHLGVYGNGLMVVSLGHSKKNYRNNEAGLFSGFTFFNNKIFGVYTELAYGLTPILKYHTFDELGNFTGDYTGVRHVTFSFGLKVNYYNKRIEIK